MECPILKIIVIKKQIQEYHFYITISGGARSTASSNAAPSILLKSGGAIAPPLLTPLGIKNFFLFRVSMNS